MNPVLNDDQKQNGDAQNQVNTLFKQQKEKRAPLCFCTSLEIMIQIALLKSDYKSFLLVIIFSGIGLYKILNLPLNKHVRMLFQNILS